MSEDRVPNLCPAKSPFFPQESKIFKVWNLSRKVRLPLIQVSSTKSQTGSRGSGLKLVMGHMFMQENHLVVQPVKLMFFLSYQDKNDNVIVNI